MDDELREASDPSTPGERLEELFLGEGWNASSDAEAAVVLAAVTNPSFPHPALASFLLLSDGDATEAYDHDLMVSAQRAAWHNPIVPTLLLSQPHHDYLEAAERLLDHMTAACDPDLHIRTIREVTARREQMALDHGAQPPFTVLPSLLAFIAAWAAMPDVRDVPGHHSLPQSYRDTARHLAGLFGLPWPAP